MAKCSRCCLLSSITILNLLQTLCGVVMIVYSLWLLKKWQIGISALPTSTSYHFPKPWFGYTCLGVGIAMCLSNLFGHVAANHINHHSILCTYIGSIWLLLLVEVAIIVFIFFKFNWQAQLIERIDEKHANFKTFLIFHIHLCRWIAILTLVPQVNVIVLTIILWTVGTSEPRRHSAYLVIPGFKRSFLLEPYSPLLENRDQDCRNCEALRVENPGRGFLTHIRNTIQTRFEEWARHCNSINCD